MEILALATPLARSIADALSTLAVPGATSSESGSESGPESGSESGPEPSPAEIQALAEAISVPPNLKLGDLCFPCFSLAKRFRQSPAALASTLEQKLPALSPLIQSAQATGPYVNFKLDPKTAALAVAWPWAREQRPDYPAVQEKVMVEYSQPNTHKAFHVGHLRNVCLGDALVRILRTRGHEVVAANYFGDVGTHIAKCLWGYEQISDLESAVPEQNRGQWLGQLYAKSAMALEDLETAAKDDPEAQTKYDAARARMTELLHGIEQRDPEVFALWEKTRQWSLDEFAEVYRWCDVHFDRDFFESEVDQAGLALVEEYFQKGVFVESEGAIGIINDEVKHMPFFMLRKRDKTGLYSTKDLALARLKFDEYDVDRSIYVVDVRQSDHFRHVFLTLKKMGFEQAERCEHVPYEMVELPSGPMAGRKGNVILFRQLREEILKALREGYFAKYRGDWSEEEIEERCHQVALGAIKYGMLVRDVNQKIVFDMPQWLKFEGQTGPYIQYAHARTASILQKADAAGQGLEPELLDPKAKFDPNALAQTFAQLGQPEEIRLLVAIAGLPPVMLQVAEQLRPSILCNYLFDLAKAYSSFQSECRVLCDSKELREARLILVKATQNALRWGLEQLGIPAPTRM